MPVRVNNKLYNCAVIIQKGSILGIVPKTHLPNYGEFYESGSLLRHLRRMTTFPSAGRRRYSFGAGQIYV